MNKIEDPVIKVMPQDIGKPEYIVVSDKNSKVLLSTRDWYQAVRLANQCRHAGGAVTIFKSTRG